jgi:hypothetical protein
MSYDAFAIEAGRRKQLPAFREQASFRRPALAAGNEKNESDRG